MDFFYQAPKRTQAEGGGVSVIQNILLIARTTNVLPCAHAEHRSCHEQKKQKKSGVYKNVKMSLLASRPSVWRKPMCAQNHICVCRA